MRIAFAGAHRTGKTTLVHALAEVLPKYEAIDEPYLALEEEGQEFSDPPTAEDFQLQLQRSIEIITAAPATISVQHSDSALVERFWATLIRLSSTVGRACQVS